MKNLRKYMKNFFKKEIERFLQYKKTVKGFSENSYKTYELNLKEALEYIDMEKVDSLFIVNLMPYRLKISTKNKKTIAKKISIVRSFISFLQDNSYKIKLIGDDLIKVPKTLPKPIDFKYIKEALNSCNEEERLIILFLYGFGLRISELSNLKKENIKNSWIRVTGKGEKTRNIPILLSIKAEIDKYLIQKKTFIYVFEKNGRRLSENSLRYKVNKIFKQIGIKATPHQLRHSYASDLLNRGGRISDVSMLLGHSSLSTTEIYTKLDSSYKLKNYKKAHPLCQ